MKRGGGVPEEMLEEKHICFQLSQGFLKPLTEFADLYVCREGLKLSGEAER